jgi:hypothetical protein
MKYFLSITDENGQSKHVSSDGLRAYLYYQTKNAGEFTLNAALKMNEKTIKIGETVKYTSYGKTI